MDKLITPLFGCNSVKNVVLLKQIFLFTPNNINNPTEANLLDTNCTKKIIKKQGNES